ncbi:MAG: branched-chain amino acid ABC transporter permease [Deltaproteobacteria bacterium]|nr:branched-chain amino acid ABC transporter permease [Deltaproteobacteria bacterium]MBW2070750.1 branched-chain amino acid ABC transporter permease [Deltaproteobacteria bacterium]
MTRLRYPHMTAMDRNVKKWLSIFALCLAVMCLPYVISKSYYFLILNIIAINALVVLGLNLLIGFAGQISLGHAAFFGMGAYCSAILTTTYHMPVWPTLLAVMLATAAIAYLIGIPTLRLAGHYLVMATLGFNIIIYILMVQMEPWTGGPSGFSGIPGLHLGSLAIQTDVEFYWLIWPLLVLFLLLSINLTDSRVGRALRAIHEDEMTANSLGINTDRYKAIVFALSAAYASVAGSMYAHYLSFISPKTFDIFYSIEVVTMAVVGGIGNIWGGIIGAAVLTALPELLHALRDYALLMYGVILMSVLLFFPEGLLPGLLRLCLPHLKKQND